MEEVKHKTISSIRESFEPWGEVRCPDCDWFMQWGHGWRDRTSYFRQSYYNPDWASFWDWSKAKRAGKDDCPRCKKAKLVYREIINKRLEESVARAIDFTGSDGNEYSCTITDVKIDNFFLGRPKITGMVVSDIHPIEQVDGRR